MKTTILLILSTFLFSSYAQARSSLVTDCLNRGGTWYMGKCSVAKGSTSKKITEATKGTKDIRSGDGGLGGTTGPRNPLENIPKVITPAKPTNPSSRVKKGGVLAPTVNLPKVIIPGRPSNPPIRTDQPVPRPPTSTIDPGTGTGPTSPNSIQKLKGIADKRQTINAKKLFPHRKNLKPRLGK